MSQHIVEEGNLKFVFGWDPTLETFYLQVHDKTRDEDDQIVIWMGTGPSTRMYEVADLVKEARKHGLTIKHTDQVKLYGEKDVGI